MRFVGVVAAVLALSAQIAPASAGPLTPASQAEIDRILDVVVFSAGVPVGEKTRYFTMKQGEVLVVPFAADATIEYYVNVVCDDDCGNVDIAALEADGTEADVDDADDNTPVLNLHASEYRSPLDKPTGQPPRPLSLEIRMIACSTETCSFGMRITQIEDWANDDES